jgi:hypothetical protein
MFPDGSAAMELYYVLVQNAAPPPRHVLCERVAAAAGGFWLYKYIPRYGIIDDGYAKDLGELKYIITQRYGWFEETFLVRGFEKAANLFTLRAYPRIIYPTPGETSCTRISGELFSAELRGDVEYVKKWIDGKKPRSLQEAMERLSEYAQRVGAWVIFKHGANYAVAYLAYPSP